MWLVMFLLLSQLRTGTASDYAIPQVFRITGKVVVGHDEPVMVVVTLKNAAGGVMTTQSFANGIFRFNDVPLGTYWISVEDPRFNLYENQLLLREPRDTGKELTVRLVRLGEGGNPPPDLDVELYSIDAETMKTTPAQAMEHFNKGVSALRNPARNNPPDVHFKRAIAAAPQFYEAHLHLGLQQLKQNKTADAIQTFERATQLKPAAARPLTELGELYSQGKQFEKVVESLTKLDELEKMSARDHFNLGSALYQLGEFDEAEEHLLSAIEKSNKSVAAYFLQLHNVYIKMPEPLDALKILEEYLKLFPDDPNHAAMTERVKQMRQRLRIPPG